MDGMPESGISLLSLIWKRRSLFEILGSMERVLEWEEEAYSKGTVMGSDHIAGPASVSKVQASKH